MANELLELIKNRTDVARSNTALVARTEYDNAKSAEAILADVEKNLVDNGRSQAIVVQQQLTGQMQAQQRMQTAIDAAGGYEALYSTIRNMSATGATLERDVAKLKQEQDTRFIDDPLGWAKAQVDWDNTATKVQTGLQVLTVQEKAASAIESRISQVGQIAKASAQTITQASIEASTDVIAREAQIQAQLRRLDGLKYNTAGVRAIAEASDKDLDYALRLGQFQRGEEQFALSLREEERRREQFDWQREEANARRTEKLEARGFEERTVYYINLAEAARGLTPSSPQQIKDQLKLKGGIAKELEDLYVNGEFISRTGVPLIGKSPAESAAAFLRNPQILQALPEERKKAAAIITEATRVTAAEISKPGSMLADDPKGEKQKRFLAQQVTARLQREAAFVGNNPDNLFYIGDLGSYIGTAKNPGVTAFQNYPLVQKVLGPALEGNQSLNDPSVVMGLAGAAVRRGDISSSQAAADISNIYKRASALHRASLGFAGFGVALPPAASEYRVKIGDEVVDVTNFVQVATAMNKDMAKDGFRKVIQNRNAAMRQFDTRTAPGQ